MPSCLEHEGEDVLFFYTKPGLSKRKRDLKSNGTKNYTPTMEIYSHLNTKTMMRDELRDLLCGQKKSAEA